MAEFNTSQAREKIMFRYTSALERGDFETVAAILAQAETDAQLAQMIREVDEVSAQEIERGWQNSLPQKRTASRGYVSNLVGIAATLVLIGFVAIATLTLTGPATGNVFSSIVMSGPSGGGGVAEITATPPSAMIEVTPLGGFMLPTPTAAGLGLPPIQGTLLPENTAAPTGTAAGTQAPGTQGGPGSPVAPMIVKNGEIDLLVENTDTAIDQVTQIATDSDGYVLSSQAAYVGDYKSATITIGVRVDQYETAMRRLRQIAIRVDREISTGQDVSSEYVDLQSRVKNLQATRDRIAALLEKAQSVEEAVEINRQLSDIEGQIEQIQGRMNYLSGRAAYSTITVILNQKIDATATPTLTPTFTPSPTSPWSLSPTIDSASKTQVGLFRGLLELVTWLVFVPGPYVLVGALAFWAYRKWWPKKPGP